MPSAWLRRPNPRLGFAWAIGGALAIHALVLMPKCSLPIEAHAIGTGHGAMALRVIQLAAAPMAKPLIRPTAKHGTVPASVTATPFIRDAGKAFAEAKAAAQARQDASVPIKTMLPEPLVETIFDPDDYLPRGQLSTPPMALDIVEVPPPPDALGSEAVRVQLRLYIDESGAVRHIERVGDQVPDAFEDAAKAAFLRARFAPADFEGQIVKSRITVQVDFAALGADGHNNAEAKRTAQKTSA